MHSRPRLAPVALCSGQARIPDGVVDLAARTLLQRLITEQEQGSGPHSVRSEVVMAPGSGSQHGPSDPLFAQAEDAVRRLEQGLGRDYDQNSARLAASAACLAKEHGLARIDHVALSRDTGTVRQGEHLFVVQGGLSDPAHLRAHMRTDDALAKPVEQSVMQLQALSDPKHQPPAHQVVQSEQVVQQHRMI